MLVLNATTDVVRVVLGAAHTTTPVRVVSSWRDVTTTAYTPGRTGISTNGTTPVSAAGSPAASTQRVVDFINIVNTDTVSHTVTLSLFDGSTDFQLIQTILAVGERIEYQDGRGIRTFASTGGEKQSQNQGANTTYTGSSRVLLTGDVTNSNATANTMQDVTALSFAVTSGVRYYFDFHINYTAAATTTGSRWSINGPTNTILAYVSRYSLTATTETLNYANAYDFPAASNATSVATTLGNFAVITGFITPSANGTVIARFASEVSSSAMVAKAGSYVDYSTV